MIRYLIAAAIGFSAFLTAPGIEAHHGWSGYDAQAAGEQVWASLPRVGPPRAVGGGRLPVVLPRGGLRA